MHLQETTNIPDSIFYNALHSAVDMNNTDVIKMFAQANFDFNMADYDGRTVLHEASRKNDVSPSTLFVLLEAEVDV